MTAFRRIILVFPLLASLVILFPACKSLSNGPDGDEPGRIGDGAPDWVVTGKLKQYPIGNFICGHGISSPQHTKADAFELAWVNGLTEISNQIMSRIQTRFQSIQRQVVHNDNTDTFEKIVIDSELETSELLAGAIKADEWYDTDSGTGHVFLAMDRIALSERLCNQAAAKKKETQGYRGSARQAEADGGFSAALKSLVRAHRALAIALSNHAKAIAVGTTKDQKSRFAALDLGTEWNGLVQDYDAMAGTIRLVPVSGNGQTANLTGNLKEPIVVRVTARDGRPLAGFPVAVRPAQPNKTSVVAASDATDEDGRFNFSLKELKATGSHSNTVTVKLDYGAIEKRTDLPAPRCTVSYLLPTRETTRISVVIHETIDGRENKNSHTASFVKAALTDLGFQVIRSDLGRPARDVVGLPPKTLEKLLGAQCDYVIVGTAEAAFSSDDTFVWYKTRLVLDALELESGKTIHFEVPMGQSTKGGSTRKQAAIQQSLQNAATVLVGGKQKGENGLLGKKFVARFESGDAWEK